MKRPVKQKPITIKEMLEEIEASNDLGGPVPLEIAMAQAIDESVKAAKRTAKKAVVTIQVDIKPKGDTMVLSAAVTRKDPKVEAEGVTLFVDSRSRLFHDDPRQEVFDDDDNMVPAAAVAGA